MSVKIAPVDSLLSHLSLIRSTLKEKGSQGTPETGNYESLVHQLNVLALRLSNGDEDLSDTQDKICQAASSLVLSKEESPSINQGRFLREEIQEFADTLLERAIDFCSTALSKPYSSDTVRKLGIVWDKYDVSFSEDNLEACIKLLSREKALLTDALEELLETDEEDSEFEAFARIKGSGLIKSVIVLNKKLIESLDHSSNDLDDLTEASIKLSEVVDDYVFSLYSISDEPESLRESSKILFDSAMGIIDVVKRNPERSADSETWGNFLTKALHHNYTQIQSVMNERQMEEKLIL